MTSLWSLWLKNKDRPVVFEPGRTWTVGDLTAEAERIAAVLEGHAPSWPNPRRSRRSATLQRIVPIREPNSAAWLIRFLAAQRIGATALPLDPAAPLIPPVAARGCCVKLTSGTTGAFKPVYCSAGHLIRDGRNICATMGIRPDDRNLALIPLGHSYGLGNLVMPLILQATPLVCAQTILPRQILELIRAFRVTVFPTVPAVLRALAQLPGASKPPSLRLVISAGAPLSADVARQFYERYGLKIHNFYGASETGGICYDRTGNATLTGRAIGKPLKNVRVRLRRDGRIVVGRQLLADLGEWNRYGELRLLGRVGVVANIGGRKVSPVEVEGALRELRGISDVWVTVLKDKRGNDLVAAAVETDRARGDIERELLEKLPAWKLPKLWLIAAALPRTDRGKLHTAELNARLSVTLP
jgi:acyl-CoA synthetase (AMP-forming)/AMP-acid ligase II